MANNDIFCGIGNIPKGKKLGTALECLQAKQVRRYGVEKIDPRLLEENKEKANNNLVKENLKLLKIKTEAKLLIKDLGTQKLIIETKDSTEKQKEKARKRIAELLLKRNNIIKRLKAQQKKVDILDNDVVKEPVRKPVRKPVKKSFKKRPPEYKNVVKYSKADIEKIVENSKRVLRELEEKNMKRQQTAKKNKIFDYKIKKPAIKYFKNTNSREGKDLKKRLELQESFRKKVNKTKTIPIFVPYKNNKLGYPLTTDPRKYVSSYRNKANIKEMILEVPYNDIQRGLYFFDRYAHDLLNNNIVPQNIYDPNNMSPLSYATNSENDYNIHAFAKNVKEGFIKKIGMNINEQAKLRQKILDDTRKRIKEHQKNKKNKKVI